MNMQIINRGITVGAIRVLAVASSSVFLIGDTHTVNLSTIADTPPDSVTAVPFVPLPPAPEEPL